MSSGAVGSLPRLAHTGRVTQARVVLSELTKLRSVRSTRWSLGVAVLLTIGLPSLFAVVTSSHWGSMGPQERADRHPLEIALAGVDLSQLAIGVLGVLVITGEYSTGMIRASMTAVPRRLPVLWAKVGVYAAVSFALMLTSVLAAYLASQAILSRHHLLQTSLSAPGVLRAVVGGALYLTVVGAFTLGLGAILRNTAGATAAFAGIMFVIPPLLFVLPSSWNDAISPYLPSSAGRAVFSLTHGSDSLAPWPGFAIFCGYAAATLAVAAVLLRRRDT
jgi:ABC-type transport system involved in multi-copper enzyme maturation permease subunit